jgi:hypothetical protein
MAAVAVVPCRAAGQESFRTSLTATVSRLPDADSEARSAIVDVADARADSAAEAAPDAATNGSRLLRCRRVTLHWAPLPDARRYTVYVSVSGRDGWRPLASRNACGNSRVTGSTTMVDIEPTTGGATVVRRLYYRVEAFDRAGGGARLIATTMSVPVELP